MSKHTSKHTSKATTTTKRGAKARPQRKATFEVKLKMGIREFTPVNKRAKRYTRVLKGRVNVKLTADDLRTIKANGTKVCAYTGKGELKTVAL